MTNRLVDYFLVIGADSSSSEGENDKPPTPVRVKTNESPTVLPISDLVVLEVKKEADVPEGYTVIRGFHDDKLVDLETRLMVRTKLYLCESRVHRNVPPLTGIQFLPCPDKHNPPDPPDGYYALMGRPLKSGRYGSYKDHLVCLERDPNKPALVGLTFVNEKKECPDDYTEILPPIHGQKLCMEYGHTCLLDNKQAFEPQIMDHYPQQEHADYGIDRGIPMICFPRGVRLETELLLPRFFTFVLTLETGEETFGAALIFYEPIPPKVITELALGKNKR